MSRGRVHEVSSPLSLFPFIGILLCTMGALLVILVVVSKSAKDSAVREGNSPGHAEAKVAAETAKKKIEEAQTYIGSLNAVRSKAATRLRDQQAHLGDVEDHIRRLHERIQAIQSAAVELKALEQEHYDDHQQATREIARLTKLITDAKKSVETLQEAGSKSPKSYAVVPYEGPNGTYRRPIYIECVKNELVLQPEGVHITADDLRPPVTPGNPLASVLRAIRDHLVRMNPKLAESRDLSPYPLLLVRPDGLMVYDRARMAIEAGDFDLGFELVEQDWKLKFPQPDPQLAGVEGQALDQARLRQQVLAAAAPRAYGNSSMVSAGEFDDDDAYGGGGGYPSGGGGGGGGGFGGGGGGSGGSREYLVSRSKKSEDDGFGERGNGGSGGGGGEDGGGGSGGSGGSGGGSGGGPSLGAANRTAGGSGSGGGGGTAGGGGFSGGGSGGGSGGAPAGGGAGSPSGVASGAEGAGSRGGSYSGGGSSSPSMGSAPDKSMVPDGYSGQQQAPSGVVGSSAPSDSGGPSGPSDPRSERERIMAPENRGKDWALRQKAPKSVPVRRTIHVAVQKDQLSIVPDSGPATAGKVIPMRGDTVESVDEFVKQVRDHIDGWGIAGNNLYWRPVIVFKVGPDGQARANDLTRMLKNSGLEVRGDETAKNSPQGGAHETR